MSRRRPFSHAQKKKQLQERRKRSQSRKERQQQQQSWDDPSWGTETKTAVTGIEEGEDMGETQDRVTAGVSRLKIHRDRDQREEQEKEEDNFEPRWEMTANVTHGREKHRTLFARESKEELQRRTREAQQPFVRLSEAAWRDECQRQHQQRQQKKKGDNAEPVDMPKRPAWVRGMTKEQLERGEKEYFDRYLRSVYAKHGRRKLNYFEHNLEVWRQLWRTIEMSDVLVVVTDIRHPLFHFPSSLYDYVLHEHGKPLLLVLNKADLVPRETQQAWVRYFRHTYPMLHVVLFSSFSLNQVGLQETAPRDMGRNNKRIRRRHVERSMVDHLWLACREIVRDHELMSEEVAERAWSELWERYRGSDGGDFSEEEEDDDDEGGDNDYGDNDDNSGNNEENDDDDDDDVVDEHDGIGQTDDDNHDDDETEKTKSSRKPFTVGLIGSPNVGKSSILNGLVGKTVVSTSYTPGHTKHFQTYHITPLIRLCDSPGLVFPAINVPRQLQILSGLYPIAQVREPYTTVQFLCERIPLEEILKLQWDEEEQGDEFRPGSWSAWGICVAFAHKRKYFTNKAGRPDVYRAANQILREALQGKIILAYEPPVISAKEKADEDKSASADQTQKLAQDVDNDDDVDTGSNNDGNDHHHDHHGHRGGNPFDLLA